MSYSYTHQFINKKVAEEVTKILDQKGIDYFIKNKGIWLLPICAVAKVEFGFPTIADKSKAIVIFKEY